MNCQTMIVELKIDMSEDFFYTTTSVEGQNVKRVQMIIQDHIFDLRKGF